MFYSLTKIRQHGGHFILGNIKILFGNVCLLKGEILLFEHVFPATFLSLPGKKYLVEVGNNKAERDQFFKLLNDNPAIHRNKANRTHARHTYLFLNTVTLILSGYLVAISSKIYSLGNHVPAMIGMALGSIIFFICVLKRRR